jgi:hypothetical protein
MSKIECKVCGATGDIRECIAGHKETDTVKKARMFEDLTPPKIKVSVSCNGEIVTGAYVGIKDNFITIIVDGYEGSNSFNLHSVTDIGIQ